MPDLEEQLTALASTLDWPATPRFRLLPIYGEVSVLPTQWGGGTQRRRGWGWALAAAAVFVMAALLLAYTPTRDAIAAWINLHTSIQKVEHPPTPSPLPSGPLGTRLGLGAPTTLEGAQGRLQWKITVPSSLGSPDEVYLQLPPDGPSGGEVTLVYAKRSDIKVSGQTGVSVLVTEARGSVNETFFYKILGPEARVENVTVAGHPGFWISGSPHEVAFQDASGDFRVENLRLATNTLVFDHNGVIVRVEGDMTKEQALQIAQSLG